MEHVWATSSVRHPALSATLTSTSFHSCWYKHFGAWLCAGVTMKEVMKILMIYWGQCRVNTSKIRVVLPCFESFPLNNLFHFPLAPLLLHSSRAVSSLLPVSVSPSSYSLTFTLSSSFAPVLSVFPIRNEASLIICFHRRIYNATYWVCNSM